MDLSTTYLGLKLRTPLVASASPLSEKLDTVKKLEDAGVSAIVLNSLYEEQLLASQFALHHHTTAGTESFAEALSYFPEPTQFKNLGPESYLEHIQRCKAAVDVPIIASLNATSLGGWTQFAAQMEAAGADAIELNVYYIPTEVDLSSADIEHRYVDILKAVKAAVKIPVAMKLSPFFTNLAYMVKQLDEAGVNGLVLFNRFYQPDIDLEELRVIPNVILSTPQALRLPLRWIAILHNKIKADLAASSGVHTHEDVLKLLMVGANVTMMASALLRNGVKHIHVVEQNLERWMEEHEYHSVKQMQGSMSYHNTDDASAFERTQYMKALTEYHLAAQ
jgi:dihydroorotate dehydrogenase (fumarate)